MAVFEYRGVVVATGKQVKGVRDADNPKCSARPAQRDGILLTRGHRGEAAASRRRKRDIDLFAFFRRVSRRRRRDAHAPARHARRRGHPARRVAQRAHRAGREGGAQARRSRVVREQLNEGTSFAKALEPHPTIFPPLYVNMVAAGEASGTLEQVLERLADFMEKQAQLARQGRRGARVPDPHARHRHACSSAS